MKDFRHTWYILGKRYILGLFQVRLFHDFQTRQRKKIVSIESAKFGTFREFHHREKSLNNLKTIKIKAFLKILLIVGKT